MPRPMPLVGPVSSYYLHSRTFFEKAWNPVNVALNCGLVLVLCCLLWKGKKGPRTFLSFFLPSELSRNVMKAKEFHSSSCVCRHSLLFCFVYKTLSTWVWRYSYIEFNPTYRHFLLEDPFPLSFQILNIFLYLTGIIIIRLDKLSCKQLGYQGKSYFFTRRLRLYFFWRAP